MQYDANSLFLLYNCAIRFEKAIILRNSNKITGRVKYRVLRIQLKMDSQIVLYHGIDKTENEIMDTNKGTVISFTSSIVTRSIKGMKWEDMIQLNT